MIGNPLLLGDEGYQIQRSLRFRSSASAYLSRTPATASNRKTWTWSGWVKRGKISANGTLFAARTGVGATYLTMVLSSSDDFRMESNSETAYPLYKTNALFRDPAAWYHFVVALDMTQATSTNRLKVFVNGVLQTTASFNVPAQNTDLAVNSTETHLIGQQASGSYFDGYLTEVNFIDGQALTPSSFGAINPVTGVWSATKYAGTYGTNGFYLNFTDNSAATATTIGKDYSGNGNNWTPNNISVTAGVTYDSMLDAPLGAGGGERGNYATLNPLLGGVNNAVMINGNLTATLTYSSQVNTYSNIPLPTNGKWYWESTVVASNYGVNIGIRSTPNSIVISAGGTGNYSYYNANGNKYDGATASAYGTSWYGASRTDVIGVAYDSDTRELTFYLNGTSQGVAFTVTAGEYYPAASHVSGSGSHTEHYNFGQRPFAYTPPTGFKALHTGNLPDGAIVDGSQYMAAKLFVGTAPTPQTISGLNFQPDLVWVKNRSYAEEHYLVDSVRGASNGLRSNNTAAEVTNGSITAFTSDGFTVGNINAVGRAVAPDAVVAWNWKAGGTAVTNTAGSITSSVSANTTAGFSVVTYTGTGANATVGHGLGVTPKFVIVKNRGQATSWICWFEGTTTVNSFLYLNQTAGLQTIAGYWGGVPNSTTFTVNASFNSINASGNTYVAYCFSEVAGYSKFGSYTGNGSADGPFIYTGFRPRYVMVKRTDTTGNWEMHDTSRATYNADAPRLWANLSSAEDATEARLDELSNGFKLRSGAGDINVSSGTYIYAAFAESPFKNSLAR